MSFIQELEKLFKRKLLQKEVDWTQENFNHLPVHLKNNIHTLEIFKILNNLDLTFKKNFVSVENLKNNNQFDSNGIIFGQLFIKRSEKFLDTIFLEQNGHSLVCEFINFNDNYLNNYVLIRKWRFVSCSNNLHSYLEIDGNFMIDILNKTQIPKVPKYILEVDKVPKKGICHVYGVVESISPCFVQNNQILFFVEITSNLSRIIVFKGLYYLRNMIEVGETFIFTCLLPSRMNENPILLNTSETRVIPKNDSLLIKKETRKLVSYEGLITSENSNSIIQLDNTYNIYFTHYSFHDLGRGIRKGNRIRIYNAHPIYNDLDQIEAFGLCMYSSYKCIDFSENESDFIPFINIEKWNHLSIIECREILKNTEIIKKKFEISEKKAEIMLKNFNFKRESFRRNMQNEFLNHDQCNICSDSLNINQISPLKDFTSYLPKSFEKLFIKSSREIKDTLIGMIEFDYENLYFYDHTFKFQLLLVNQSGKFGDLDIKWSNSKETVFMIEEYILVQESNLIYIQADINSLKILYRFDPLIEVYTPRNIKDFIIEKMGNLINNHFNIYCQNDIIIKANTEYSPGLYYLLKSNYEYEFGNLKMIDQKSYEMTETSTIRPISESNSIDPFSSIDFSLSKPQYHIQLILLEVIENPDVQIICRDPKYPIIFRVFLKNLKNKMGLIPGSKMTLFDLKYVKKDNPYFTCGNTNISQIDYFPFKIQDKKSIL